MAFTPEKPKQIALARLDLIYKWLEFRKKSTNKLQADYDFVNLHNTSDAHLFEILGKISHGSLHRWYAMLNRTEDYTKLLPLYKYSKIDDYRTVLTDEEIKIFMGLLLHPNRISIGKATALTKYKLKEQGQSFIPADILLEDTQNGLRTTIMISGFWQEMEKKHFQIKLSHILNEMRVYLMSEIFLSQTVINLHFK